MAIEYEYEEYEEYEYEHEYEYETEYEYEYETEYEGMMGSCLLNFLSVV